MNESRLDPPYEKEVAYCDGCHLEIYPSDDLLESIDGIVTHNSLDCVKMAFHIQKKTGEQYRREREIDEKERLSA
jgi:hypothetical protein